VRIICTVLIAFLITLVTGYGQSTFMEIHSTWDDQYGQWEVIVIDSSNEEQVITIDQVWPLNNNFEEWRITSDFFSGRIKTQWTGDLSKWEVQLDGRLLQINQKWRNDVNHWEVRYGNRRTQIETRYRDDANTWVASLKEGDFAVFTEYRDDPRDWIIEDYIVDKLDDEEKLALVFICLFQSIPKS